jgi:hypothetical protein
VQPSNNLNLLLLWAHEKEGIFGMSQTHKKEGIFARTTWRRPRLQLRSINMDRSHRKNMAFWYQKDPRSIDINIFFPLTFFNPKQPKACFLWLLIIHKIHFISNGFCAVNQLYGS